MKKEFLEKEIWMLTIGAAFQRANVYCLSDNNEAEKKKFKTALHKNLIALVKNAYHTEVSEESHIENIWSISKHSEDYASILTNGKLNFGVSQKMLNLYLKYQWCLGTIPTPPHFPVDRIIQNKLGISIPVAWTQMKDEVPYLKVINKARKVNEEVKHDSLSELELHLFSRN